MQNVYMSDHVPTKGNYATDFLPALANCMANIGEKAFNQNLLSLIECQLEADQVMVFSYTTEKPSCYLSYNTHAENNANQLAQKYLETGHTNDPLKPEITRLRGINGTNVFTLDTLLGPMKPLYRQRFFDQPGIVDKLTVLARRDGLCLAVSFYRFKNNGPFPKSIIDSPLLHVLGQLALLHYSSFQSSSMFSPLLSLSDREREICEGILRGKTTDAIAWELQVAPSTVTTYRKRAYTKLAINSKSALFTLCGKDT